VLLIDDDGSKQVMPAFDALNLARDRGLDLVEVAPTANPPVVRILDYGKFKYEQAKKEREAHKHQKVKVSVMFRGREITHPEIGRELLLRVVNNLGNAATVEKQPSMEGRFMNMILAPVAPKPAPKPKQPRAERPPRDEAPGGSTEDGAMAAALRKSGVSTEAEPPSGNS
jgi:translation initiation factor IF-3